MQPSKKMVISFRGAAPGGFRLLPNDERDQNDIELGNM